MRTVVGAAACGAVLLMLLSAYAVVNAAFDVTGNGPVLVGEEQPDRELDLGVVGTLCYTPLTA
ncbi:hypothetical protein O7599_05115 [Streptomyces sp. WMMC500]|uniref:hypothetical protein n=1 Tax=Streptomyces sp. WMMC500 TaxID=3015154 RepID=UPI00248C907D|nr:hypothetical protein [Streptomyces sp. WMMC500]WBB61929.1 hypothetical protein O7599_05115 [Streptomyces sp. WMMC500]